MLQGVRGDRAQAAQGSLGKMGKDPVLRKTARCGDSLVKPALSRWRISPSSPYTGSSNFPPCFFFIHPPLQPRDPLTQMVSVCVKHRKLEVTQAMDPCSAQPALVPRPALYAPHSPPPSYPPLLRMQPRALCAKLMLCLPQVFLRHSLVM